MNMFVWDLNYFFIIKLCTLLENFLFFFIFIFILFILLCNLFYKYNLSNKNKKYNIEIKFFTLFLEFKP